MQDTAIHFSPNYKQNQTHPNKTNSHFCLVPSFSVLVSGYHLLRDELKETDIAVYSLSKTHEEKIPATLDNLLSPAILVVEYGKLFQT